MRSIRFLTALAAAAAVLFFASACSDTAVDDGGGDARAIRVSGSGEVQAAPTIATVRTGVEVRAESVTAARAAAAEAANAVYAALHATGVADGDISTIAFQIYPEYDYRDETPRVTGYGVSNTVEVTVRAVDRVGEMIDAVAAAAGDAVRFDGIVFAHDDPGALAQEARALAMADARGKAEHLATLSGVTLGAVRSITETRGTAPFAEPPAAFAMEMDAPTDTATWPGTAAVTVTVQVVWAIAPEE